MLLRSNTRIPTNDRVGDSSSEGIGSSAAICQAPTVPGSLRNALADSVFVIAFIYEITKIVTPLRQLVKNPEAIFMQKLQIFSSAFPHPAVGDGFPVPIYRTYSVIVGADAHIRPPTAAIWRLFLPHP